MSFPFTAEAPPLQGRAVFLSASVPDPGRDPRFLAGPVEALLMRRVIDQRLNDAVQSLVAQVLIGGGRLVHGGHPSVTRAIASQAGNWSVAAGQEPPILLYQSAYFRDRLPPPGRQEMEQQGFAAVRWTPAKLAEVRVAGQPLLADAGGVIQPEWLEIWWPDQAASNAADDLREALLAMRLQMLLDTQPQLALCLGGMEGIKAEANLWLDLCRHGLLTGSPQIRAIVSTFGATKQLDPRRVLRVHEQAAATTAASARDDLLQPLSYDALMRDLVAGMANLGQS